MTLLTPDECRALGVLIEKAQTTPAQYPLTLNALVSGANQRSNRDPVTDLADERVLDALLGLRKKGLAREVNFTGSRVEKYRHVAREALGVETPELVLLAELLLRGPQSVGELRARATRMHPLESLEAVQSALDGLAARPEPLVAEFPPPPGSRAKRYAQLLCPGLHPLDAPAMGDAVIHSAPAGGASAGLTERVERLERGLVELRTAVETLTGLLRGPGERPGPSQTP